MSPAPAELEATLDAAIARGDFTHAATIAIRGYGPAILGYLRAVLASDSDADEAFAMFSEDLWRGLGGFRGDASVRTWGYRLAYHAALRVARDPYRRRGRRLASGEASRLAVEICSRTPPHLRSGARDRLAELRRALTPAEQTLLVLKIDRKMSWREVASVLDDEADEAALRKRFDRLKQKLRRLAGERGLL